MHRLWITSILSTRNFLTNQQKIPQNGGFIVLETKKIQTTWNIHQKIKRKLQRDKFVKIQFLKSY